MVDLSIVFSMFTRPGIFFSGFVVLDHLLVNVLSGEACEVKVRSPQLVYIFEWFIMG